MRRKQRGIKDADKWRGDYMQLLLSSVVPQNAPVHQPVRDTAHWPVWYKGKNKEHVRVKLN